MLPLNLEKDSLYFFTDAKWPEPELALVEIFMSEAGNFWMYASRKHLQFSSSYFTEDEPITLELRFASLPGTICLNCLTYGFNSAEGGGDEEGWCLNHVKDFQNGFFGNTFRSHSEWTLIRLNELQMYPNVCNILKLAIFGSPTNIQ
jgi:hypothetical protein